VKTEARDVSQTHQPAYAARSLRCPSHAEASIAIQIAPPRVGTMRRNNLFVREGNGCNPGMLVVKRIGQRSMTRRSMLALLSHPAFWDRKVRIAILTLATFAAMC
jgi:hypothetical protein